MLAVNATGHSHAQCRCAVTSAITARENWDSIQSRMIPREFVSRVDDSLVTSIAYSGRGFWISDLSV